MSSITPVEAKSLVKIKNGKSEGTRIFAHTSKPLKATAEYLDGFIAIRRIIISKKRPNKKLVLFEIFLLCLTMLFIISYYMFVDIEKELLKKAKLLNKTIVFPEAGFSARVLQAAKKIVLLNLANVVLIGEPNALKEQLNGFSKKITIVNPNNTPVFNELANKVFEIRKAKGLTLQQAKSLIQDPIYFANAYVLCGYADGIVCGAEVSTAQTLRPALQIIKSKTGLVSSYFLFVGKNKVTSNAFLMGDCGVVENPTAKQEFTIAQNMLEQFNLLGLQNAKVAFLSYSTLGSAVSDSTQKVKNATELFKQANPNIDAVGEVQVDASIVKSVAKTKMPNHAFTKPANIFVMPNIDAGNICYKMVQYFGGLKAIGPITMGFNKPVNDLSRGCTINDIVLLTAITCIQSSKS